MTPREFMGEAVRLAVEAGSDPARARERMAQLAQTYALAVALNLRPELAPLYRDREQLAAPLRSALDAVLEREVAALCE